jgi:hypothetical protein
MVTYLTLNAGILIYEAFFIYRVLQVLLGFLIKLVPLPYVKNVNFGCFKTDEYLDIRQIDRSLEKATERGTS